jgi:hypothetical protein
VFKIFNTLKLSILLAQYFYQHKQLNLPGIGAFHLDAAVTVPDANDKNFREFLKYIQFTQKPIAKPDEALIDFIRTHTGKIKPLAESDLESYLADGKLLLNIGKPFHIEGIGTLSKNKLAIYEFESGEPVLERLEAVHEAREVEKPVVKKKSAFDESYSRIDNHNKQRKGLLVGTLAIVGLAVILWGGYTLYNKDGKEIASAPAPEQQVDTAALLADSLAKKAQADSITAAAAHPGVPAGSYKFVLETTAKKARAFKRHAFLFPLNKNIQLETKDSLIYSITLVLPATAADTIRLKDSLNGWYYGTKPVKVSIAQ